MLTDFFAYNSFSHLKLKVDSLIPYGFTKTAEKIYDYQVSILDNQFILTVSIYPSEKINTTIVDALTKEEYTLYKNQSATGSFVSSIRKSVIEQLDLIVASCFETTPVFQTADSQSVINYVQEHYQTNLEFLWKQFPNDAVLRRSDSKKWYAALMKIPATKIGLDSDNLVEILDIRMDPDLLINKIDNNQIFPGYHMNKKHWVSILLNGQNNLDTVYSYIDASYELAK